MTNVSGREAPVKGDDRSGPDDTPDTPEEQARVAKIQQMGPEKIAPVCAISPLM